jgi:hypothetical protein
MKPNLIALVSMTCLVGGCAAIKTSRADLARPPQGVRVYPPAVYLFVDKAHGSQYVVAPDYRRAYDVRPRTFFAQQAFGLELSDGVLARYAGDQDTTGPLSLLQRGVEVGARAAGVAVSQVNLPGNFGYPDGVYRLDPETGTFERIDPPKPSGPQ